MCTFERFGINLESHYSCRHDRIISKEWEEKILEILEDDSLFVDFEEFGIEDISNCKQITDEEFEAEFNLAKTKPDSSTKIQSLYRYISNDLSGYNYSHKGSNTRKFCSKLVDKTNRKFLKMDAIVALNGTNPGQGPEGSDSYSIFNWRGGKNCKHIWVKYFYNADTKNMVKAPESQQPTQIMTSKGGVPAYTKKDKK